MNCIKQECYKLLDKIMKNNKLNQENMDKISKLFASNNEERPFARYPILITNVNDLADQLQYWYNDCGYTEKESIHAALALANKTNIDVCKHKYWFFVEGTNLEEMIKNDNDIIEYFKLGIRYDCFECELSHILCTLRNINADNKSLTEKCVEIFHNTIYYTGRRIFQDGKIEEYETCMFASSTLDKILKIFVDADTFTDMPLSIERCGWEKEMTKFFHFDSQEEREDIMKEMIRLLEITSIDIGKQIDVENNYYWLYRDGLNGELWFDTHQQFLTMLENQIKDELPETQLKIIKECKRIQEYRKKSKYFK